jgi:hypothetical protein
LRDDRAAKRKDQRCNSYAQRADSITWSVCQGVPATRAVGRIAKGSRTSTVRSAI